MGESPNFDWIEPWKALSRRYATAWQAFAGGEASGAPASAPWSAGAGGGPWTQWLTPGAPPSDTLDRFVDGAKNYLAFLQMMAAMLGAGAPAADAGGWGDALRRMFATAPAAPFAPPFAPAAFHAAAGAPAAGAAAMRNAFDALRPPPAAFGLDEVRSWLSLPAFGYLREHQERSQKAAVAWIDYQEQIACHNELMMKASRRGFERFEAKLAEREQPERPLDSLRALYDLWVDAAEEGYAEVVSTEEYREVYGALVNAQMRVRAHVQQEVERLAGELGMPTRSELNTLGERVQALRREMRERKGGVGQAAEIAALKAELAALKAAQRAEARAARADELGARPSEAAPAPPRRRTVRTRPAAPRRERSAAAKSAAPRKAAASRTVRRTAAATASGSFASRIAKYANASLGSARARPSRPTTAATVTRTRGKRR
ncbi:MAG TPA: class III poly(R)-hydroxyalkanoic acid synthase subunit PhaE [Dokdonella sp.]